MENVIPFNAEQRFAPAYVNLARLRMLAEKAVVALCGEYEDLTSLDDPRVRLRLTVLLQESVEGVKTLFHEPYSPNGPVEGRLLVFSTTYRGEEYVYGIVLRDSWIRNNRPVSAIRSTTAKAV